TDGSISNRYDAPPNMGFAWILPSVSSSSPLSFKSSTTSFTSSTKAESFAIFSALIICPENSTVTIFSDSQSSIATFNNFSSKSPRRKLKQNNFLLWHAIESIIQKLRLNVNIIKIKAHSGIHYNELADQLAKEAT